MKKSHLINGKDRRLINGHPSIIFCDIWHFYHDGNKGRKPVQSWNAWIMDGQVVKVSIIQYNQWIGEDAKSLIAEMKKKGFKIYA